MMTATSRFFFLLSALSSGVVFSAQAEDPTLEATVDSSQVAMDQSVSLKIKITSEGTMLNTGRPLYSAPDFETLDTYQSSEMNSIYENGRILLRNTESTTVVLRPKKKGTLRISGIAMDVNGKKLRAPDITVEVVAGGQGTPPGNIGSSSGLSGTTQRGKQSPFFLKAEVSKTNPYKGEQVIVSYYVYSRGNVISPKVRKFPVLNGFLREELEMPVVRGNQRTVENVIHEGTIYRKELLARYAVYPLQEGKISIDEMELKASYYPQAGEAQNDDAPLDPFSSDPFFQKFFNRLNPQTLVKASPRIQLNVKPLPSEGRPEGFSGTVGKFEIVSATNRNDVRVNEALTYTVKIEGRGNVSSIEKLDVNWPDSIELYESKGTSKSRGGIGQKVFEFLLIPKQEGLIEIPEVKLDYFDPETATYQVASAPAVTVQALPSLRGDPGLAQRNDPPQSSRSDTKGDPKAGEKTLVMHDLLLGNSGDTPFWARSDLIWGSLYKFAVGLFLLGIVWAAFGQRSSAAQTNLAPGVTQRLSQLQAGAAGSRALLKQYQELADIVLDALEERYGVRAHSLSRRDLQLELSRDHGVPEAIWKRIDRLLEYAEMVQFASSAGAVNEGRARQEFDQWVSEGARIVQALGKNAPLVDKNDA